MTTLYHIMYLAADTGRMGRLPDLGIINAGGVAGPSFVVDGKPLMFADGTATDGSGTPALNVSLQGAYDGGSTAQIDLTAGRTLVINALNGKQLQVDPATGRVRITGDLEVLGSSTVIEGTVSNVDQINIAPPNQTTVGLRIEPLVAGPMLANLVEVRPGVSEAAVFVIDGAGVTSARELSVATDLTVGGLINGVDLVALSSSFTAHVSAPSAHSASAISAVGPFTNIVGSNVEDLLVSIDGQLAAVGSSSGYAHTQAVASTTWTVAHGASTTRVTAAIYDSTGEQVIPDSLRILDGDTVQVTFASPQAGTAILTLF